ncbi:MAG TPA: N-acetylmuramoyl-L-alanine amidase [Clostridiaceae bacterium]
MLPIQKLLIKYNFSSGNNIQYIVIHDTGNPASGANALMHYKYFNGGDRQASAHYFVDDNNIIQTVEDSNASWHCGDGGGAKGIGNHNSIGIEICINSEGNYSKAVQNAVDLTKYLMNKYGVDLAHVVRHYDASGKLCPGSMAANNWAKWGSFKAALSGNNVVVTAVPSAPGMIKYPTGASYNPYILDVQRVINKMGIATLLEDGKGGTNTMGALEKVFVKRGDKNILVGWIQKMFNIKVDNSYGNAPYHETYDKIIAYQKNKGLTVDGIVGKNTILKMCGYN